MIAVLFYSLSDDQLPFPSPGGGRDALLRFHTGGCPSPLPQYSGHTVFFSSARPSFSEEIDKKFIAVFLPSA